MSLPSPVEQLWYVGLDGVIVNIPTKASITIDTCGDEQGANSPKFPNLVPPRSEMLAFIHTHPRWAHKRPTGGDYKEAKYYDVYGIHDSGAWVIRKGAAALSPVTVLVGAPPSMTSAFKGGKPCM